MINTPPLIGKIQEEINKKVIVSRAWSNWFMEIFRICRNQQQSGTTAQRPVKELYIGRRYFDTTLTKPIWYSGTVWVDATGSTV